MMMHSLMRLPTFRDKKTAGLNALPLKENFLRNYFTIPT